MGFRACLFVLNKPKTLEARNKESALLRNKIVGFLKRKDRILQCKIPKILFDLLNAIETYVIKIDLNFRIEDES